MCLNLEAHEGLVVELDDTRVIVKHRPQEPLALRKLLGSTPYVGREKRVDRLLTAISTIADLRVEVHKCCSDHGEIEDKIWEMDDLDVLPKLMTGEFAQTLLMSDAEFIEQQDRRKKLRELLRSIAKKTPLIEVSAH